MRSKQKTHRYSCAGFDVADAQHWWMRKGAGHAARAREARSATWQQSGRGSSQSYVTFTRPKHKHDTVHEERTTTIMCDAGRIVAYAGHYRKGM